MINRILFLLLIPFTSLAQSPYPVYYGDSITTIYRVLNKKSKPLRGRIQLINDQSSSTNAMILYGFDRMPSQFKKLKLTGPNKELKISFTGKDALTFAKPIIENHVTYIYNDSIFYPNKKSREWLYNYYQADLEKYYSGKYGGKFFKYNWMPLVKLPDTYYPASLEISGWLFKKYKFNTDRLPASIALELPAIDTSACVPYNRFHNLRKMKGYGIDKFSYIPYKLPSREVVRSQFEIYFDRNSANATAESLDAVVQYLRNNDYSILSATVEGYSSVEGDDRRNINLQKKRAGVLLNLLQKNNNEPILRDTVIISPGYDLFRQAIKNSPYAWLDTLSNEKMQATINQYGTLMSGLEPYLQQQRKAVLKLTVAKRLEGEAVVTKFTKDFRYLEKQLNPNYAPGINPKKIESKMMGMMEYLQRLIENELISPQQAADLIDNCQNNQQARVLFVYHNIIQFEKKQFRDSLSWENMFKKYHYNEYFSIAQSNLISMITNPPIKNQIEKYKRQLVDIQTYSFDYVRNNLLSTESLCDLSYPDNVQFRGYKLNQLAFLQELSLTREVPCEELRVSNEYKLNAYSDDWLVEKTATASLRRIVINDSTNARGMRYPTYDKELYSPYLFYLKKLFVEDEASITKYMSTSDNFQEFDLFTLASYNVESWDPRTNYFADKEIQLNQMDKIITQLKRINKRICPQQVNQLYLTYHLKSLHYIDLYFEAGNNKQAEIAQRSMKYIADYYAKNAGLVTPKLSLYLLKNFNGLSNLPGKYDATWYAWSMLTKIAKARPLSSDEAFLLSKYQNFYTVKNP